MTREQQFGIHTRRFIIKRKDQYICISVYLYKKVYLLNDEYDHENYLLWTCCIYDRYGDEKRENSRNRKSDSFSIK